MFDDEPCVGVFWGLPSDDPHRPVLVSERVKLSEAEPYGECLTFGPGHEAVWSAWREAPHMPDAILTREYDEVPRGRVVFHQPSDTFWLYADRRLQGAWFVSQVVMVFNLVGWLVDLRSDGHYR